MCSKCFRESHATSSAGAGGQRQLLGLGGASVSAGDGAGPSASNTGSGKTVTRVREGGEVGTTPPASETTPTASGTNRNCETFYKLVSNMGPASESAPYSL